jgi:hypothetical protein
VEQPSLLTASRSAAALLATAVLISLFPPPIQAATKDDFGQLSVRLEHMAWPSPASIVRDLRSQDDGVRFKALLLLGVSEKLARIPVWSNTTPSVVTGSEVVKPEQVELRYAALGSDETQQAIVVAQYVGTFATAAVATPKSNGTGWERIAIFDCGCKYERNVLDEFVSLSQALEPSPHFELVLRASGGGTGIYTQNEAHFRLYRGEMKAVISFVSRVQSFATGTPQQPSHWEIERRWFDPALPVSLPDGRSESVAVLVESQAEAALATIDCLIPELQDRYLKRITCRPFRWNPKVFNYEPVSGPDPCKLPER